jgi:hypothetical protein
MRIEKARIQKTRSRTMWKRSALTVIGRSISGSRITTGSSTGSFFVERRILNVIDADFRVIPFIVVGSCFQSNVIGNGMM